MNITEIISNLVDVKSEKFKDLSDKIWEFSETRFEEFRSAKLLCDALEEEGFTVERGVAGLRV